jgi:hypothetical protein
MKQIIWICSFLLSSILIFSCEYRQLCYISPSNDQIKADSLYYFENDTIRIVYSFWKEKGILGYEVYNKLQIPIYIDWKKSSFVVNNVKMNYWADETISSGASVRATTYYSLLGISESSTVLAGKSVKPERVTFLAPHSGIVKADFILWNARPSALPPAAKSATIHKPGYTRPIPIKYVDYNKNNTPITFRNFITYSTTETFSTEIYLDNEFYISRIAQLKYNDFGGKDYYDKATKKMAYEQPFNSTKAFYMTVK